MVQLSVLGAVALRRDGEIVAGRPAQRHHVAILAYLAASSGGHASREKLIGLLWPEHDSSKARHRLSVALHVLRQGLGVECLETSGDTVTLNRSAVCADVCAFVEALDEGRLQEAVRHYGGPFLDGFYLPDALEFEPWMEGERQRLEGLYRSALERLAEEAEQRGDLRAAAEWWRRLAAQDRYSSSVTMRLMRALAAIGDVAAAVRQARTYATLVEGELEVPADPEVLELAEELVKQGRAEKHTSSGPTAPERPESDRASAASPPQAHPTVPRSPSTPTPKAAKDLPAARRVAGWAALAVLVTLLLATILSMGASFGSETASEAEAEVVPFGNP